MRLKKKFPERRKISAADQLHAALHAVDFADDVRGTFGRACGDFASIGFKFFRRDIAQGGDRMRQPFRHLRGGLLAAFAPLVVGRVRQAVFDVRIDNEKLDVVRQFDGGNFQGSEIGMNQSVVAAENTGELIEQSAVGACELMLGPATEPGDLFWIDRRIETIEDRIGGGDFERRRAGKSGAATPPDKKCDDHLPHERKIDLQLTVIL